MTLYKKLKIRLFLVNAFLLFTLNPVFADKLDDLAACGGVIIGNGVGDYQLGNEMAFEQAFALGRLAYLGHFTSKNYGADAITTTEAIMGANTDKIIMALNSGTFDSNTYEEVIACYRMIGMWFAEESFRNSISDDVWKKLEKDTVESYTLFKRMLDAGA